MTSFLYIFSYHSRYVQKKTASMRYIYHCTQNKDRQQKSKKITKEGVKQRDKEAMAAFNCNGWLHITIWDNSSSALVRFKHENEHVPYWNIDVPSDTRDFIRNNLALTPTQVSTIY